MVDFPASYVSLPEGVCHENSLKTVHRSIVLIWDIGAHPQWIGPGWATWRRPLPNGLFMNGL